MLRSLSLVLILVGVGCKDKAAPPAANKAPAAAGDKDAPAEKAVDKPAEKAADKPAEPVPAAGPAWEKYTSQAGGFSIDLPGKGEERPQGPMTIVGAEFGTTAADPRTAMCGATFMDIGDAAKADPKTLLDGATMKHKEGAKIIEEKEIKAGKYPGRHLVIENSSHRKWMRVYIVETKIYIVNCGGPFDRAATDGPVAQRVLESFALTK